MHYSMQTIAVTTDASGAVTEYTGSVVNGRILAIRYVDTDLAAGAADFVFSTETTGTTILTATNAGGTDVTWHPRAKVCDEAAADVTYDGTNEVYEPIPVADERIKLVVAQGGNAKSGTFYIITD